MDTKIQVYADWVMPDGRGLPAPQRVGELTSTMVRNKELFSFNYAPEWLNSAYALPIDPDLQLFGGRQFSGDNNFRVFLDSCPDRWGRLLMKRREAALARLEQRRAKVLLEVDYLLGVHNQYRMGGYVSSVNRMGHSWTITTNRLLHPSAHYANWNMPLPKWRKIVRLTTRIT